MVRFPNYCDNMVKKILPKRFKNDNPKEPTCIGKGGPCRYFICIFYMIIYAIFIVVYVHYIHPRLQYIYSSHLQMHRVLTFLVLPWPWIIFIAFQFMDPGVITPTNVLSYMKKYPYDNVLYKEGKVCPTIHVPVVARSRYCRYTRRRVACYDHYCPWVLASIGERTHRFFLLFLLSDIIASVYYAVGSYLYLRFIIKAVSERVQWSDSTIENIIFVFVIIFRAAPFVLGIFVMLVVIAAALLMFLVQQIYYVSVNKTQIELDKIDKVKMQREMAGYRVPYHHFYNHGFIQNWKEFLFPEKVEEHEPIYFEDDHAYEVYLESKGKKNKAKPKKDEQKTKKAEDIEIPDNQGDKMAFNLSKPKLKKA